MMTMKLQSVRSVTEPSAGGTEGVDDTGTCTVAELGHFSPDLRVPELMGLTIAPSLISIHSLTTCGLNLLCTCSITFSSCGGIIP